MFNRTLTVADAGVTLMTRKTGDALVRAERVFTLLVGAGVGIQALIDVWSQRETSLRSFDKGLSGKRRARGKGGRGGRGEIEGRGGLGGGRVGEEGGQEGGGGGGAWVPSQVGWRWDLVRKPT